MLRWINERRRMTDRNNEADTPHSRGGLVRRMLEPSAVRYLLVGGSAFLFDAGLLALFREIFHWPVWVSAGTAFVLSFFFTYTLQRAFSFQSELPHGQALMRYIALVAFNTLATMSIVAVIALTPLGWFGGKVIATALTTVWNYFIYRWWVFPPGKSEPLESAQ